jgi:hypothetical protein
MKSMAMAPVSSLPKEMQAAPERVRTAYQFAAANPDDVKNVPCYCGCGAAPALAPERSAGASVGHTSNLSCYVKELKDGKPVAFDNHALGCSLCVDITQEVIRLKGQGLSPSDVRAQVVADFSKFGPGNQ